MQRVQSNEQQQLDDEQDLKFSRMLVKDANFSLKRMATVASRSTGDTRVFEDSDFFLPQSYVDQFAHEVKSRATTTTDDPLLKPRNEDDEDDDGDKHVEEDEPKDAETNEGDPTDGTTMGQISSCTDNWKAAASDQKKRAMGIFEETGIFAMACRHGQVMWLADMIRSGEL